METELLWKESVKVRQGIVGGCGEGCGEGRWEGVEGEVGGCGEGYTVGIDMNIVSCYNA